MRTVSVCTLLCGSKGSDVWNRSTRHKRIFTGPHRSELFSSREKLTMDFAFPLLVPISFQQKWCREGQEADGGKGEAKGGFKWISGPILHLFFSILQGSGLMCHRRSHLLLEWCTDSRKVTRNGDVKWSWTRLSLSRTATSDSGDLGTQLCHSGWIFLPGVQVQVWG